MSSALSCVEPVPAKFRCSYADGRLHRVAPSPPVLTVINYSGGAQSTALLWMVLLDEIERPPSLLVLNADPGMENEHTYRHVSETQERCAAAGIEFEVVRASTLLADDLIQIRTKDRSRIDNPAYFTRKPNGRRGQLPQKCTRHYKIAPMDRAIRRWLKRRLSIPLNDTHLGLGIVEKWIGFARDEAHRVKPPQRRYIRFAYPLIDLGMRKADVEQWYADRGIERPPRSVCNACFANGLDTLREMHRSRPDDWAQAVAVDDAIRDMRSVGVEQPAYVSDTLIPLRDLAALDFDVSGTLDNPESYSCDSGYCFT